MRITIDVEYDNADKVNVVAKPIDFMRFEREYGKSIAEFGNELHLEWVLFLAWSALRRQGEPREFEAWAETVVEVTPDATEVQTDPLEKPPPTIS